MRLNGAGVVWDNPPVEAALRKLYEDYLMSLPEPERVARALMDEDFERWAVDLIERNAADLVASCIRHGDLMTPQCQEKLQRQVIDWVQKHQERLTSKTP